MFAVIPSSVFFVLSISIKIKKYLNIKKKVKLIDQLKERMDVMEQEQERKVTELEARISKLEGARRTATGIFKPKNRV